MPSSSSSSRRPRTFLTDRKRTCVICGSDALSQKTVRRALEKYRGWQSNAKYLTVLSDSQNRQSTEASLPRIWIQVTDTEDRPALDVHVVLDSVFEGTDVHPDTLRSAIAEGLDAYRPGDTECRDTMSTPHVLHLSHLARSYAHDYMEGMGSKHPEGTFKIISVVTIGDFPKRPSFSRGLSSRIKKSTGISEAIESFRTESLRQREDNLRCSNGWTTDLAGLVEIGLDGAVTESNIDHTMTSRPSDSNDVIGEVWSDCETYVEDCSDSETDVEV